MNTWHIEHNSMFGRCYQQKCSKSKQQPHHKEEKRLLKYLKYKQYFDTTRIDQNEPSD